MHNSQEETDHLHVDNDEIVDMDLSQGESAPPTAATFANASTPTSIVQQQLQEQQQQQQQQQSQASALSQGVNGDDNGTASHPANAITIATADRAPLFLDLSSESDGERETNRPSSPRDSFMTAGDDDVRGVGLCASAGSSTTAIGNSPAQRANAANPTDSTPNAVAGPSSARNHTPGSPAPSAKRVKRSGSAQLGLSGSSSIPPLPHFSVTRASTNSPENPHIIRIHRGVTDAPNGRSTWPANTQPGTRIGRKLNWHDCQDKDEGTHRMWRLGLGAAIAREMELSEGSKNEYFILDDWPENYLFTIHHSTSTSSHKDRTDPYLFGSPATRKFRSINEFVPHLLWLLQHGPDDDLRCQCKYCSGNKLQRTVNHDLGIVGKNMIPAAVRSFARGSSSRGGSPAPSSSSVSAAAARKGKSKSRLGGVDPKRYVPGESASAPSRKAVIPSVGPSLPASPSAKPRLRGPTYNGTYTNKQRDADLGDGARFRIGELVWVALPKPLEDRSAPEGDKLAPPITHWPALVSDRGIKIVSRRVAAKIHGAAPSLRNEQTFIYSTELIAVADEFKLLPETNVLAWRAYEANNNITTRPDLFLAAHSIAHVWNGQDPLRPLLEDFNDDTREACTTFALALQIAAHIIDSFSLSDKYKLLEEHIKRDPSIMTEVERRQSEQHLKCWHYQQLWQGAELIWSGELVRLLVSAEDISENAKKPPFVPTSKLAPGAGTRSLFFKSVGIYRTMDRKPMVAGRVYELRPLPSASSSIPIMTQAINFARSVVGAGPSLMNASNLTIKETYMPSPPPGYEFHLLTHPDENVHLQASYIAGRYHPLPKDQYKTKEDVEKARASVPALQSAETARACDPQADPLSLLERQLALAGLTPSFWAHSITNMWARGRHDAIVSSEEIAQKEMFDFFNRRLGTNINSSGETVVIADGDDEKEKGGPPATATALAGSPPSAYVDNEKTLPMVAQPNGGDGTGAVTLEQQKTGPRVVTTTITTTTTTTNESA